MTQLEAIAELHTKYSLGLKFIENRKNPEHTFDVKFNYKMTLDPTRTLLEYKYFASYYNFVSDPCEVITDALDNLILKIEIFVASVNVNVNTALDSLKSEASDKEKFEGQLALLRITKSK